MTHASYVTSARAMALGAAPLAWFCAATWPTFSPPLTIAERKTLIHHRKDEAGEIRSSILVSGTVRLDPPGLAMDLDAALANA